jgi:hypothetical protein
MMTRPYPMVGSIYGKYRRLRFSAKAAGRVKDMKADFRFWEVKNEHASALPRF